MMSTRVWLGLSLGLCAYLNHCESTSSDPVVRQTPFGIKNHDRFEDWIELQANRSWHALLSNIGVNGTHPGIVLASPS